MAFGFAGSATRTLRIGVRALAFAVALSAGMAQAQTVSPAPGRPALLLGTYDLGALGYTAEEFFINGTATAYDLPGGQTPDGRWEAKPSSTAPYATRIVAVRPSDPAKFNGTVVVEWLNVSAGADGAPDWSMTHRELIRSGYAYVAVSAQKVGVEGGPALAMAKPLKAADPARYGQLSHPGDAYAYDIYTQAGRVARNQGPVRVLGALAPKRVIAIGESQSAVFLTTYVNAAAPLAKAYDGYLIHSRFGPASRIDGQSIMGAAPGSMPQSVKLRTDLAAPILVVQTETDIVSSAGLPGYWSARQPDAAKLRIWEIAGAAHADTYLTQVGHIDAPATPLAKIAAAYRPGGLPFGGQMAKPVNSGPQHHYVVQNALVALDRWVRTGEAPARAEPLELASTSPPTLAVDANGLAKGGVRTPWVDAPVARLSGAGNSGGGVMGSLFGVTETFDQATLDRLYPGGKRDYLRKFETALDKSIKGGFLLPADRQEILGLAELMYPGAR